METRHLRKVGMFVLNNMLHDARVTREATSLAREGYQVTVYALLEPGTRAEEIKNGFRIRRLPIRTRPLPKSSAFWAVKYLEFVLRTVYNARRDGNEVYHGHDMTGLVPAWLASRYPRRHLIYDAHELFSEQASVPQRRLWQRLEHRLIPQADLVIAPEENRSRILYEEYGATAPPLTLLNCPFFYNANDHKTSKPALSNTGRWRYTAIYQGGIDDERCVEELVISVAYFPDDTGLLLVGPIAEDYKLRLVEHIDRLDLHSRVEILPPVPFEQLVPLTLSADVGVMLYRNNSRNNFFCAPNKLFEYMMAGLPVIGPDYPGVRGIVADGGIGILVDPTDPRSIGAAVGTLLKNETLYAKCRQHALHLARSRYNWGIEENKLLHGYSRLTRCRGSGLRD